MKKLSAVLFVCLIAFSAVAQDGAGVLPLDKLGPDLSTLFGGIGDEILVNMNQIALAGNTIGDAELGRFPHFTFDLLGVGATVFNGIGSVLRNPDTIWQFEALPLPDLIESNISGTSAGNVYNTVGKIFGLPSIRGDFGVGIVRGFELTGSLFFLSDKLIFGLIEPIVTLPDALANLEAQLLTLQLGVRKVLISETKRAPALSVSVGGVYSETRLGYVLTSLGAFLDQPIDLLGSNLDLSGNVAILGHSTGFGVDLQLSKAFLRVFVPFMKLSTWYHISSYDVSANLEASQTTPGDDTPFNTFNLDVAASNSAQDVSVYVTTGLEIKLFILVLHASVGANLQGLSLAVGDAFSGNFDNTNINRVNLNLGLRIQI